MQFHVQKSELSYHCRTKAGCFKLEQFAPLPLAHDSREYVPQYDDDEIPGSGFSPLVCGGELYVAGGYKEQIITQRVRIGRYSELDAYMQLLGDKSFFKYNAPRNEWIVLPSMLKAHYFPALVQSDGFIYAVGGNELDEMQNTDVERYDIVNERWEEVASMPWGFRRISAVSCHDSVIVLGEYQHSDLDDGLVLAMYDQSETWRLLAETDTDFVCEGDDDDVVSRMVIMHESFGFYAKSMLVYYESSESEYKFVLQLNKLNCDMEGDKPSITVGERVDLQETFAVDLEETFDDPAQTFAFDKRKLGMVKLEYCRHKHHMEG